jgi:mRNA interferase ChpB
MKRGDIYMVSLDPIAGHEQGGHRPVMIVSATAFNKLTQTPVVAPITNGGNFARIRGFAVELEGTKTQGIVRCDQVRTLDILARKARKVESAPAAVIQAVVDAVSPIFE